MSCKCFFLFFFYRIFNVLQYIFISIRYSHFLFQLYSNKEEKIYLYWNESIQKIRRKHSIVHDINLNTVSLEIYD